MFPSVLSVSSRQVSKESSQKSSVPIMNESYLTDLFLHPKNNEGAEKQGERPLFAAPRSPLRESRELAFNHLTNRLVNHQDTTPKQLVDFHNYLSFLVVLMRPGYDVKEQAALSRTQVESHLLSLFQKDDKGMGLALPQDEIASVCDSVLLVCTHSRAWSASSTADTKPLAALKQHIQKRSPYKAYPIIARSFFGNLKQLILSFFKDPPAAGMLSNTQIKSLLNVCRLHQIPLSPAFLPHTRFLTLPGQAGSNKIQEERTRVFLSVLAKKPIQGGNDSEILREGLVDLFLEPSMGGAVSLKAPSGTHGYQLARFFGDMGTSRQQVQEIFASSKKDRCDK